MFGRLCKSPCLPYTVVKPNKEECAITPRKMRDAKAINQMNKERYDRLTILVPKGRKAVVEEKAREVNESVSTYTNRALLNRMGYNTWPDLEERIL